MIFGKGTLFGVRFQNQEFYPSNSKAQHYLKNMNKDYNKKKHLELLKKSEKLKNKGKSLYKESRKEDLKLLRYNATIENYLF
jgi:hypothetical protein